MNRYFSMVKLLYKMSLFILCSGIVSAPSFYAYGQVRSNVKNPNKISIGVKSSTGALFSTNKKTFPNLTSGTGIVFTKPINTHLRTEAMINYNMILNRCCIDKIYGRKPGDADAFKISLPVTMQYYPLKPKSKLQAYVGVGAQYNFNYGKGTSAQTNGDVLPNNSANAGTKYISLIFTQGVTYKINTKIEVFQSALFIPDANKTIGLNIGIVYTIP